VRSSGRAACRWTGPPDHQQLSRRLQVRRWEKFRDAEITVAREAGAVVSIHRLSQGLSTETSANVREQLKLYVQSAIADDWTAMAHDEVNAKAGRALDNVYAAVLRSTANAPNAVREVAVMDALLTNLDVLTQARRTRFLLATGIVPSVLWMALVCGAVVTLGFTCFFGSRSIRAQSLMTGMLAMIIFLAMFVAVEIDHPFSGPVSVGPEALRLALEQFDEAH
jgi:hypothetical protein